MELELVENGVGVGTDGSSCYLVRLEQRLGWHWSDAWSVPGAEGLIYAPLDWKTTGGYHYKWEETVLPFAEDFHYAPMDFYAPCFPNVIEDRMPAFAVRAEGADARLSLRLEPQEDGSYRWGSEQPWQGGNYSLVRWYYGDAGSALVLRSQCLSPIPRGCHTAARSCAHAPCSRPRSWRRRARR